MTKDRPRIGLFALASEWIWGDAGLQNLFPELTRDAERDMDKIINPLREGCEVIEAGIVKNVTDANLAIETFKKNDIDILVVCTLMWSDDAPLLILLDNMPHTIPMVLWCYLPERRLPERLSVGDLMRRSGPVSTLQFSAPLIRKDRHFELVIGPPDKDTISDIVEWAKAAKLVKRLRNCRIGLLPCHCEYMTGTFVDGSRLKEEFGPAIEPISVAEYKKSIDNVPSEAVKECVDKLCKRYPVVNVTKESLTIAARASMGLSSLIRKYGLDILALNDLSLELHEIIGLRPCICVPGLFDDAVITMEADISAGLGLFILKELTGELPMFTEIFNYDLEENTLLIGHPGLHDIRLADRNSKIRIVPDYEYAGSGKLEGVWMEFTGMRGRITLLSFTQQDGFYQMIIMGGGSLSSIDKLQGYPHMYIKPDVSVEEFYRVSVYSGITQHWGVVHGEHKEILKKFARVKGMKLIML